MKKKIFGILACMLLVISIFSSISIITEETMPVCGNEIYVEGEAVESCPEDCETDVVTYPEPGGVSASDKYLVRVYDGSVWKDSFVYKSDRQENDTPVLSASYTTFSFSGSITIEVTNLKGVITSAKIRPSSYNIAHSWAGNTLTFNLSSSSPPKKMSIEINGQETTHPLFIFADPKETYIPLPSEVDYYFGPGVYNLKGSEIMLNDDDTVYIAGGAVVQTVIYGKYKKNVKIFGRGILSGELYSRAEAKNHHLIYLADGSGNEVSGITLVDWRFWYTASASLSSSDHNIIDGIKTIGWRVNTDGVAWCQNTEVRNSFFFVNDDAFTLQNYWNEVANDPNAGALIESNVIWVHKIGAAVMFCAHTYQETKNVTFRENDIIHWDDDGSYCNTRGVFHMVHNGPGTLHDFTIENVRVEGPIARAIGLTIDDNPWGIGPPYTNAYNILFKNVTFEGPVALQNVIYGWSSTATIGHVTFDNLIIEGQCINNLTEGNIDINSFTHDIVFLGCGNGICEEGETVENCAEDCKKAEWGFFGLNLNQSFFDQPGGLSDLADVEWTRKTGMIWKKIETPPGSGNYNWTLMDEYVTNAQDKDLNAVFVLKTGHGQSFSEPDCYNAASQSTSESKHLHSCPILSEYEDKWRELVKNIIERYDGDGISDMPGLKESFRLDIQIENEAGSHNFWCFNERKDGKRAAEEYINLLRLSYEAKQSANPDTNIILTGLFQPQYLSRCAENPNLSFCSSDYFKRNRDFTNEVLKYPQYFDAVDIHLFNYFKFDPYFIGDSIEWLKGQMRENGYEKPIYSLEWTGSMMMMVKDGNHSRAFAEYFPYINEFADIESFYDMYINLDDPENKKYRSWFESEQAREFPKLFITMLTHGVEKMVHVKFVDYLGKGWDNVWWNWQGIIKFEGNETDYVLIKKPSYYTYNILADNVRNFISAEALYFNQNVFVNKFTFEHNDPVFVLWADRGNHIIDLSDYIATENVKISHIVTELDSDNNPIYQSDEIMPKSSIKITETPVFIEETSVQINVDITKPEKGHFYLFNRELANPYINTMIIGKITITANVYSNNGVDKVEFYIDGVLKSSDSEQPYGWTWNEFAIGKHTIKVVAYDNASNITSDDITIWKLF